MTSIIPTGDNILVELCDLPEDISTPMHCGIISVQTPSCPFHAGDKIIFESGVGEEMRYKGKSYVIISCKDVLGKVSE